MTPTIDLYSYGGGVQSTAMLVLAATGRLPKAPFVFADVGHDSEHPDTMAYLAQIARPYAERHGIEIIEVRRRRRDGSTETLRQRIAAGSMAIPVRRSKDGPPMSRSCTADFKVRVIGKWIKATLGSSETDPAHVALGISVDEIERAKPGIDPRAPYQHRVYPLLDLGLHRHECESVIASAGLPVPPPSSCSFCPFHDLEEWRRLKRRHPDRFQDACDMEAEMSASTSDGRPVFLTRHGRPLATVVDDQLTLDGMDGCDSGWCMT